ncbi:hypothetical protein E2320_006880 [Naja naja]|nr:hypothetical protein E2320_006880 [Naja naja]
MYRVQLRKITISSILFSFQGCPEDNTESNKGRCLKTDNLPEDPDMKNAPWYAGSCDRRTAEAALLQFNKLFDSVSSIIQKYSERPLVLIDGSTSAKEQTRLLFPVTP